MVPPLAATTLLALSCADDGVQVGLLMRAPQGLLDSASKVELRVIDGEIDGEVIDCDGPAPSNTTPTADAVQIFELGREGCKAGASWCKEITLDRDDSEKVFHVVASAGDTDLAQGCTKVAIDQDPLEVDITIERYLAPACCGNGVIEPGEQCDNGAPAGTNCAGGTDGDPACLGIIPDDVCECDCLAKEILVSPVGTNPATYNELNSKLELALSFSGNTGTVAGSLRSVFTDATAPPAADNSPDIHIFHLDGNLYPTSNVNLNKQLFLASCSDPFSSTGVVLTQHQPDIDRVSDSTAGVVYASNQLSPTQFDVYVAPHGPSGCMDEAIQQVNVRVAAESLEWPAIATGPEGTALIVWTDGGAARGRIWNGSSFSPDANSDLGAVSQGTRVRVDGHPNGWVLTYTTGGQVWRRTVALDGTPGAEATVGAGDSPDVAVLPDGRSAIVWQNAGNIFVQRYDAADQAVVGDAIEPINPQTAAGAGAPAISGGEGLGEFFAIAWPAGGDVWGRFTGASEGFAYNYIDGQNRDYLVSHPGLRARDRSGIAVAVGGTAPGWVAIGWLDNTADGSGHNGMYVRRFPLPDTL